MYALNINLLRATVQPDAKYITQCLISFKSEYQNYNLIQEVYTMLNYKFD